MVGSFSSNARRPSTGSWIHSWLSRRRHPDAFQCGIRVVDGAVPGESSRWRYRDSAIDPHASGHAVALNHGNDLTLFLRFNEPIEPLDIRTRANHVALSAVEVATGARVQVSVSLGELVSFGVEI